VPDQAVGDDTHVIEHETVEVDYIPGRHELRFEREGEDPQQQRMLARLREAGDQPVAFAELHAAGIDFPAAVVSELQVNGFAIDRVYDRGRLVGVRLLEAEPSHASAPRQRRLGLWRQR